MCCHITGIISLPGCFFCTIRSGELVLKEHEAAKWLTEDTLESVDWLPADKGLVEGIRDYMGNQINAR